MTLSEQQRVFTKLTAQLVTWAYAQGYELTWGEAWRSTATARVMAEQGKGIANSLHCDRLAVDLLLWKDGVYLTDSADYTPLGVYWESLDPLCRWGGHFTRRDGNHFSMAWGGRA